MSMSIWHCPDADQELWQSKTVIGQIDQVRSNSQTQETLPMIIMNSIFCFIYFLTISREIKSFWGLKNGDDRKISTKSCTACNSNKYYSIRTENREKWKVKHRPLAKDMPYSLCTALCQLLIVSFVFITKFLPFQRFQKLVWFLTFLAAHGINTHRLLRKYEKSLSFSISTHERGS